MSLCFLQYHNASCGPLVDLDKVLTMVVPAKAAEKARTQPRLQVHFKIKISENFDKIDPT